MTADLDVRPLSGEELIAAHRGAAWHVIHGFRLSPHDAEDAWQATCEQVLLHAGELRNPASGSAWVWSIARSQCLRLLRHQRRNVPFGDMALFDRPDPHAEVDERLLRAERAAEVRAAVGTLRGRRGQMMRMLMADPPATYAEVTAATGLATGSIGPSRRWCLDRLRHILSEREEVAE